MRYVGAGAIAVGGLFSILRSLPLFARTFRAAGAAGAGAGDIPMRRVVACVACVIVFIACVPAVPVGFGGALMIALFGFFFAAAFAVAGVLLLMDRAWGFGSEAIAAPQAMLMKSIVEGIMGGTLPWGLLGAGAGIACALALLRLPVMPCALGIYLPVRLNATIFVGGVLRLLSDRFYPAYAEKGTLLSAGLIAGEGVCGILLALLAVCR